MKMLELTPENGRIFRITHIENIAWILANGHAALAAAKFTPGASGLERIDWPLLQARDFSRDPNDPGKIERYQAEVLVHRHLPVSALDGIVCRGPSEQTELEHLVTGMESDVDVASKPDWYFS